MDADTRVYMRICLWIKTAGHRYGKRDADQLGQLTAETDESNHLVSLTVKTLLPRAKHDSHEHS